MRYPLKIGDFLVYIFIILITAGSFIGLWQMRVNSDFKQVVIEVDGAVIGTYDFPTGDEVREVRVDAGPDEYNIVRITKDGAYIQEANCSDQICVKWGKVTSPGQTIVCLPHRVVVKVTGNQEGEPPLDDIAS